MADNGGEPSSGPKAIASLAKKQSDVTRQGAQRLKFVPTLPSRRKKEEVKQEAPPSPAPQPPPDKGNAKGRGKGRGRGGEGRGAAPRTSQAEMIASGPFAMGPALAGTSARRSNPRQNFTPIVPQGPPKGAASGSICTLKKDKQHEHTLVDTPKNESDAEVYSDPDEGVEIIDMENVRQLDWMAPEILQRDRRDRRKNTRVKKEFEEMSDCKRLADPSNAIDLSESEDEEELDDLMQDFTVEDRLYFFQFPEPFPTFVSPLVPDPEHSRDTSVDISDQGDSPLKRKVSFATETKPPGPASGSAIPTTAVAPEMPKVDGVIGHVEVYRSGAVKMRFGNGIVLNVSEATQPSFLQQAVHLDMEKKTLHVLGEVNKRFVVSPDLDALLASLEVDDRDAAALDDPSLIKMDIA